MAKQIGIRGSGSHAKKLINILADIDSEINFVDLARDPSSWKENAEKGIDGIIICSPNSTHLRYVEAASKYFGNSLIYCEKPFVHNSEAVKRALSLIDSCNLILGFNFRHSSFCHIIDKFRKLHNLGNTVSIHAVVSYPFSLRHLYDVSWKSKIEYAPLGVLENLAIHYLDLFNYAYTVDNIYAIRSNRVKSLPTTVDIIASSKSDVSLNLHCSYSEEVISSIRIACANGSIWIDDCKTKVISSVLEIDPKTNLSISPKAIFEDECGLNLIYKNSLENSMKFFYDCLHGVGSTSKARKRLKAKDREYVNLIPKLTN